MNAVWPHLPALQVVVPLLGAVLAAFLRRGATAFALALVVSWLMPFIAGAHAVAGAGTPGRSPTTSAAGSRPGASSTASMC